MFSGKGKIVTMLTSDYSSTCEQARTYYYDYVCGESQYDIPAEMLAHIDNCSSCQNEVGRLKGVLAECEEHGHEVAGQSTSAITTGLKFHFAYVGALVGCDTAKLFLPGLAIGGLEVSVQSPITVHLEKCQECERDLRTIQQLGLSDRQLGRLGQLFAEEPRPDAASCAEAQGAISSVGAMTFENTSAAILRHLSTCPDCRRLLYEERKRRSEELTQDSEQSTISCDAVSAADIFDFVVPYGIEPDHYQYAKSHGPLKSHLVGCPKCLEKVQKLHETIYRILERPESGIVTCYKVLESVRDSVTGATDEMYDDWPIQVKVFDRSSEAAAAEPVGTSYEAPNKPRQRHSAPRIKPFIKVAAVAAVAILAALVLLNAPVAKALDLGQINKALGHIRNVYFAVFDVEKAEPTQEIWISQALNIMILRSERECVLWDTRGKSKKTKNVDTGSTVTTKPNNSAFAKIEETMRAPWGLLPSDNIFKLYPDARWERVPDEDIETPIPDTEVYDLVWAEEKFATRKWRGYIDIKTKVPKRIEWWLKLAGEDYKPVTVTKVSYPTKGEIKAVIKEAGL